MNRNDKVSITYGLLVDTADAIRAKKGTSSLIDPSDFPSEVESISGDSSPIKLSMSFKNNTPSIAYGEIVLSAKEAEYSGNYDIMWGDASGVLSAYTAIATLSIDVANGKTMDSVELIEFNKIPTSATKLCAVKNGSVVTSFDIPSSKLWNSTTYGSLLYKTIVFSDSHYGYDTAASDIQAMLQKGASDDDVVAFVSSGDMSANGTEAELDAWNTLRDTYRGTKPVYACNGNHEARNSSSITKTAPEKLRKYLDSDWVDETEPRFVKVIENDVYVFVPCWETLEADDATTMFSSTTLAWLEEVLETYRNQRVFLFAHVPPHYNTDGLRYHYQYNGFALGNGAYTGDDWGNPQKSGKPLADRTSFLNLIDHYKNVIWFSGHSHIKFINQKYWAHLNVMQYKGGARFVHVSSLSVPRDLINGYTSQVLYAEAEFYEMEVYTNTIVLKGYDLINGKYFGVAEYLIDTTPVTIPSKSKTLVSISASKTKTSYYTDESASGLTDDITVTATWSDNTSSVVNNSDVSFNTSSVDLTTVGTYTIGISYTYDGVTETTSVQITSAERPSVKTLSSIVASKVQSAYNVNDVLSTSDVTAVASYSDTTTQNLSNSDLSFNTSQIDMTTAGVYPLVVSYTEGDITVTATISITVSDASGMTVILDATFSGQISSAGGTISSPTVSVGSSNGEIAHASDSNAYGKTLYYRLLSNTGISKAQSIGFKGGVYNSYAGTSSSTKYDNYSLTATDWTEMKYENNTAMSTSAERPYVTAKCTSSSSSTATFPVTVNARLQIGYVD